MAVTRKFFKQCKVDDKIYILASTNPDQILESSIVDIHHSFINRTTQFKTFRIINKADKTQLDEKKLKDAYELEGKEMEKVFFDVICMSHDSMITLVIKPPMVVCTTREELKAWMS